MKAKLGDALRKNNVSAPPWNIFSKSVASFASYGFPPRPCDLVCADCLRSAWLKVHRPNGISYAALLNNQPMGFYSPLFSSRTPGRPWHPHVAGLRPASAEKCQVENDDTIRLGLILLKGVRQFPAKITGRT